MYIINARHVVTCFAGSKTFNFDMKRNEFLLNYSIAIQNENVKIIKIVIFTIL